MAKYRSIPPDFWTDELIDGLPCETRYVLLYLLTNSDTHLLGIYKLNVKKAAYEAAMPMDIFKEQMKALEESGLIMYSERTHEIALRSWLRYQVNIGGKVLDDSLTTDFAKVEDKSLLRFVWEYLNAHRHLPLNQCVKRAVLSRLDEIYKNETREEETTPQNEAPPLSSSDDDISFD